MSIIDITFNYKNTPFKINRIEKTLKNEIFLIENSDIVHISAQNIDCGNSLEPPRRSGSNEYPQSMFFKRNKKDYVHPKTQVLLHKSGV